MNRSLLGHWEARPRATRHLYGLHFHPTWQLAHFTRERVCFILSLAFYFSVLRWLSFHSFKEFFIFPSFFLRLSFSHEQKMFLVLLYFISKLDPITNLSYIFPINNKLFSNATFIIFFIFYWWAFANLLEYFWYKV